MPHSDFDTYRLTFQHPSLRNYMRMLLVRLEAIHSRGIIHRDIKPHNIFYNTENETMKLADFGLAEQLNLDKEMSIKVACRFFKSPELLMEVEYYFFAIDIWAVGVIFASIVSSSVVQTISFLCWRNQHRTADKDCGSPWIWRSNAVPNKLQIRNRRKTTCEVISCQDSKRNPSLNL